MVPLLCSRCRGVKAEDRPPVPCVALEGRPCSACKERATIRQKVKQLENEIAKLNARYNTLTTTINEIHDPFIHKLPPEIGSHIFSLSLPTLDNGENYFEATHRERRKWTLRLGAVCRKWRQLAWATPNLWETLFLAIGPLTRRSLAPSLPRLLREWIGRSGALPLTIFFLHSGWPERMTRDHTPSEAESPSDDESSPEGDSENESPSDDESTSEDGYSSESEYESVDSSTSDNCTVDMLEVTTDSVIEILNSQSGRWRNLSIHAGADIFNRFSDYTQPIQLVELELKLEHGLQVGQFGQFQTSKPKFEMVSKQNPTHLKLTNFPLASANICLDNITHANLRGISLKEGLDFLRQAPSLEYYCVLLCESHETGFKNHILHLRLRRLHLLLFNITNFLDAITLPRLEILSQDMSNTKHLPMEAMLSFLNRSGCSLKVLKLEAISPQSTGLRSLLQRLPSLEWLQLLFKWGFQNTTVMDEILTHIFDPAAGDSDVLVPDVTREPFLPRLQFLECLTESGVAPFSWDRIPQLYRQGHRWSLALRSAAFPSHITDETALQLLQLVDEGVGLEIHARPKGGDFLTNFRHRISAGRS